jgi:hypothetical protein
MLYPTNIFVRCHHNPLLDYLVHHFRDDPRDISTELEYWNLTSIEIQAQYPELLVLRVIPESVTICSHIE